jgi:hypothetical protein
MGLISRAWTNLAPLGAGPRESRPRALRSKTQSIQKGALIPQLRLGPGAVPR